MENQEFYLDRHNINSNNYDNENNKYDFLFGPFKKINFFTGSNSSGKSRLIRNIFSNNQLVKFNLNHTHNIFEINKLLDALEQKLGIGRLDINNGKDRSLVINEEVLALKYFFKNGSSVTFNQELIKQIRTDITQFNLELTTQEKINDFKNYLIGLNSIFECIYQERITVTLESPHSFYVSTPTNNLNDFYNPRRYSEEIISSLLIEISFMINLFENVEDIFENNKTYIPVFRYSNKLYSDWNNKVKDDSIHLLIRKQYNLNDTNTDQIKIFTGQNLFDEIVKYRTGKKRQRIDFYEFEKFLSLNFFDNKEIDLVSNVDLKDNVNNNISITIDGNEKPFFDVGDGIQSIILLLFPVFTANDNSWLFIEEPENSLHPLYQRLLIETLLYNDFINKKNLTFFISTHSNHILDGQFWGSENISISLFRKTNIEDKFLIKTIANENGFDTLKELGVLNTSVLIGNCAIWVEGITDRLYIKKLIYLYLEEKKLDKEFKENNHFVFFEYAGSNIAHYIFDEKKNETDLENFIESNKLSNKIFLIADYDFDSSSKKPKKDARREKLEAISSSTDWFKYYNTNPRKEIENILSPQILNILIPRLISDQTNTINPIKDSDYKNYQSVGLGKYLTDKTFTKNKIQSKSGTLSTPYKNQLANLFFESEEITWDILSDEAKDLTTKLITFIKSCN